MADVISDVPVSGKKKECKGLDPAYTYDLNGNRATMSDPTGTTLYQYDALNRLTKITNPSGKVINYSYDALGRRTGITYSNSMTAAHNYDGGGRLLSLQYQLSALTNAPPITNALSYWNFDEGGGDIAGDGVSSYDGTIYGCTWSGAGKYGNALSFNGSSDYVGVPHPGLLNLGDNFTIEAWVKQDSITAGYVISTIDAEPGVRTKGYALYINTATTNGRRANSIGFKAGTDSWGWDIWTSEPKKVRICVWFSFQISITNNNLIGLDANTNS